MALYKVPGDPYVPEYPRYSTKSHSSIQMMEKNIISASELKKKSTTRVYLFFSNRMVLE